MATRARPVVHWEIQALDPQRSREFYATMFEWVMSPGPIPQITGIEAGIGGPLPGPGGHIQPGDGARVALYVQVADIGASVALAVELGGKVLREPFAAPSGETVARIADPEGNQIGLVQQ